MIAERLRARTKGLVERDGWRVEGVDVELKARKGADVVKAVENLGEKWPRQSLAAISRGDGKTGEAGDAVGPVENQLSVGRRVVLDDPGKGQPKRRFRLRLGEHRIDLDGIERKTDAAPSPLHQRFRRRKPGRQ